MQKKVKTYFAYLILAIGFYVCACLTLLVLNLIGIGSFDNILSDSFSVALIAGALLLIPKLCKRYFLPN